MGFELLLLAVLWAVSGAAAMLGWRCGCKSRNAATGFAGALCLSLVAGACLAKRSSWIPESFIVPLAVYLQASWFAPLAMALFFLAAQQALQRVKNNPAGHSPARRQSVVLRVFAVIVLLAASIPLLGAPSLNCESDLAAGPGNGIGGIDADGVVHQSTGYTCAASSCATLLRRMGIDPQATEKHMVPLCMTRRWGGATTLGMAVGLKRVAAPQDWHVRILEPDWNSFCRLRMPVVCAIRFNNIVDHAVVVCAVDRERGVQVADPLNGLSWWPIGRFRQSYQNEVVSVFRADPFN